MSLSAEHTSLLSSLGIDVTSFDGTTIESLQDLPDGYNFGPDIEGSLPALLFWWVDPEGVRYPQLRLSTPVVRDGTPRKYLWTAQPGSAKLGVFREGTGTVLISEGTKQSLMAALYAPLSIAVYGIAGCWGWSTKDGEGGVPTRHLRVVKGRDVIILLDADASSNLQVYEAGVHLRTACINAGALSVRFAGAGGSGKAGLDDVLSELYPEDRADALAAMLDPANTLLKPSNRKPTASSSNDDDEGEDNRNPFLGEDGGLLVAKLANDIREESPCALSAEEQVAVYENGVYKIGKNALLGHVTARFGNDYRTHQYSTVVSYILGELINEDLCLIERPEEPLLNLADGMLNLRTLKLLPHDPKYLSSRQLPIPWDSTATCPTYDKWAHQLIGDQLSALEEDTSTMLDPSTTPIKAILLFGPSRSGKGTWLRLAEAIAGRRNCSSIPLHRLCEDPFAAANVYNSILNTSGDLPSAHIEDISMFKMMTGDDVIPANRKYGNQFDFRNLALFLYSMNEIPSVGEASTAYFERTRPYFFGESFAGSVDPDIERQMMRELPGILVRWVKAWQRFNRRGGYAPINQKVQQEFEQESDRVRRFVAIACRVVELKDGTTGSDLYVDFKRWLADVDGVKMGKIKFMKKLRATPGVVEDRIDEKGTRGFGLKVKPRNDWDTHMDIPNEPETAQDLHGDEHHAASSNGHKSFIDPVILAHIQRMVPEPEMPDCPDCGTKYATFGSADIFRACPQCHASSFQGQS